MKDKEHTKLPIKEFRRKYMSTRCNHDWTYVGHTRVHVPRSRDENMRHVYFQIYWCRTCGMLKIKDRYNKEPTRYRRLRK